MQAERATSRPLAEVPTPRPARATWQLIVEPNGRGGAENMALDAALLRMAHEGGAALRLYRWTPATLSFGRNEPATRRYDREAIDRLGVATVRRPSGGRAVWHDAELTYAVAAPAAMFGTLREAYIGIHRMLAAALSSFGITPSLAPERRDAVQGLGSGACFAAPVGGEIVAHGRKLVGSAQVREGRAFLQHGTMLLDGTQDVVAQVARGPAPPDQATAMAHLLGRPVAFAEAADAVAAAARELWPGTWRSATPEPPVDLVARFADPAWTWRR